MPFSQSEIDYPVSVPSGQPLSGTQENHMSLPWVTPKLYRDWHHSLQPSAACGFALCSASYLLVFSLMAQCPFYKGVSHASVYFTFFFLNDRLFPSNYFCAESNLCHCFVPLSIARSQTSVHFGKLSTNLNKITWTILNIGSNFKTWCSNYPLTLISVLGITIFSHASWRLRI